MGAFGHPAYSHEGHDPIRQALQREFDNLAPGMFFDLQVLDAYIDQEIRKHLDIREHIAATAATVDRPANTSSTNPDPIQPSVIFYEGGEGKPVDAVPADELMPEWKGRRCSLCNRPAPCDLVRCVCTRQKTADELAMELGKVVVRDFIRLNSHEATELMAQYRAAREREGR